MRDATEIARCNRHRVASLLLPPASSSVYPVVFDVHRTVLSLPPIINGEHSKIGLGTRNVFIECTANDLTKAHVVLNTVVAMFSEYCDVPFVIEPVHVSGTGGMHN
jgi:phenylalanyl-tRNA synthetase beta chain